MFGKTSRLFICLFVAGGACITLRSQTWSLLTPDANTIGQGMSSHCQLQISGMSGPF